MATSVTNRVAAPALRGQAVKVTLDSTDAANLANFTVGQTCTCGSTSKVGYIYSIDVYGMSFLVTPNTPDAKFDSTATGILSVSETISIT